MTTIKAGDVVTIYGSGRRGGGVSGEVVKIGRTLAHIRYYGRTETFRLDTQRMTGPQTGYGTFFETAADGVLHERMAAAEVILREHKIALDFGHRLTLDQIEALAEVARTFTDTTDTEA